MKQDIITRAQNIITQRRISAENAYKNMVAPLYQDEEYVNLEREQTRLLIENAKKESLGENPDTKRAKDLAEKLLQIKTKHNLQNAKIEYSCPVCHDEGYVNGQRCKCLNKEISNLLKKNSGFEKLENFKDSIKTCGKNQNLAYEKMQRWCSGDSQYNLVLIYGKVGAGKTFLTRCMANELIEAGKIVKLTTSFGMNQDFKAFSKYHNENLLDRYITPEILFIDDLGTEPKYENVTLEYMYFIINERKMKNLKTVITSNKTPESLLSFYDERIFSRLSDSTTSLIFELSGEDKRIKK